MKTYILLIFTILSIMTLELIALFKGINGVSLSLALSTIGGVCGYGIKFLKG